MPFIFCLLSPYAFLVHTNVPGPPTVLFLESLPQSWLLGQPKPRHKSISAAAFVGFQKQIIGKLLLRQYNYGRWGAPKSSKSGELLSEKNCFRCFSGGYSGGEDPLEGPHKGPATRALCGSYGLEERAKGLHFPHTGPGTLVGHRCTYLLTCWDGAGVEKWAL